MHRILIQLFLFLVSFHIIYCLVKDGDNNDDDSFNNSVSDITSNNDNTNNNPNNDLNDTANDIANDNANANQKEKDNSIEDDDDEGINDVIEYEQTDYLMSDIEKFKVSVDNCSKDKYSTSSSPLNFTTRHGETFKACDYQYLCHKNEKCIKVNLHQIYSFNTDLKTNKIIGDELFDGKGNRLIVVSCDPKRRNKDKCSTTQCTQNSECFSNNCTNGMCMVKENNPAYLCRTVKVNEELKVKCFLNHQEKCKFDNDCADNGYCIKDMVCQIDKEKKEIRYITNTAKDVIVFFVIAALIFSTFGYVFWFITVKSDS